MLPLVFTIVVDPHEYSVLPSSASIARLHRLDAPRALLRFELEISGPVRIEGSTSDRTSERDYWWCVGSVGTEDVDGGKGVRELRGARAG